MGVRVLPKQVVVATQARAATREQAKVTKDKMEGDRKPEATKAREEEVVAHRDPNFLQRE